MDCSRPGFPVLHHLPELVQIHVHWDSDAIQPSHPLPFPSLSAFNLSQHEGLFQWVASLHQMAKVELQLQHQSFQWIVRVDFLSAWLVYLLAARGTLKSLLQHHNLRTSILWHSAFFIVHLSHPYIVNLQGCVRFQVSSKNVKLTFNVKNWGIKQKFLCKQPLEWKGNQIKTCKMTEKCWYYNYIAELLGGRKYN